MAAQARIVLFSWVLTPAATRPDSPLPGPSRWTTRPPQARYGPGSRRWGAGAIGWRVIGANNRELGRGALPAGSVDEACQAVRAAQLTFDRQMSRVLLDAGAFWSWHMSLDGHPVTVSSRGYHRQRECDYSLEQFRAQFPTAEVVRRPAHRSASTRRGLLTLPPLPSIVVLWTDLAGPAEVTA